MSSHDRYLEPPDDPECCGADDCTEPDEDDGRIECHCEDHWCGSCGLQCACRCDSDYDAWRDERNWND